MKKAIVFLVAVMLVFSSIGVHALDTCNGYPIPVDIAINGNFIKCAQKPVMEQDRTYIPLRALTEAIGGEISWNPDTNAATMTADNHSFVFFSGKDYCIIDGAEKSFKAIEYKDLLFVPARAVAETLGYDVEWDDLYLTVKINAPSVSLPDAAIDWNYSFEDIMYLSKITHIESGSLAFKTRIGVADTVLNRKKSPQFPNTIKDVIFDTKYSTQFPPAHTEKFNNTPSKESVIAAKLALNGVNLVGNSLYFVDVDYQSGSWVHNNRKHRTTLGTMAFYE